eukprot:TRINITY_DN7345_c0_g1_i4.p1 TRINITY_DN7345_c0_g1~~TRINITY_DN7345_c0_g1_i4.p1  ORF type:complete len:156 (-),score=14.25 TRINITY_DN7345_c0_g1_i4:124-591(-)
MRSEREVRDTKLNHKSFCHKADHLRLMGSQHLSTVLSPRHLFVLEFALRDSEHRLRGAEDSDEISVNQFFLPEISQPTGSVHSLTQLQKIVNVVHLCVGKTKHLIGSLQANEASNRENNADINCHNSIRRARRSYEILKQNETRSKILREVLHQQ